MHERALSEVSHSRGELSCTEAASNQTGMGCMQSPRLNSSKVLLGVSSLNATVCFGTLVPKLNDVCSVRPFAAGVTASGKSPTAGSEWPQGNDSLGCC